MTSMMNIMNVLSMILHMNINTHLKMNHEDDNGPDKDDHNEGDGMAQSKITWQPFVSQHWGKSGCCHMFKRLIAAMGIPAQN